MSAVAVTNSAACIGLSNCLINPIPGSGIALIPGALNQHSSESINHSTWIDPFSNKEELRTDISQAADAKASWLLLGLILAQQKTHSTSSAEDRVAHSQNTTKVASLRFAHTFFGNTSEIFLHNESLPQQATGNKFAPSPSPLPRGERVRERVSLESNNSGIIRSPESRRYVLEEATKSDKTSCRSEDAFQPHSTGNKRPGVTMDWGPSLESSSCTPKQEIGKAPIRERHQLGSQTRPAATRILRHDSSRKDRTLKEIEISPRWSGCMLVSGDAGRGTPVWRQQPRSEIACGFEPMRRCRKRGWPATGPETTMKSGEHPTIIVRTTVEGVPSRVHYIRDGVGLHFAGWEEEEQQSDTYSGKTVPPIPTFVPAGYLDQGVFGLGTPGGESAFKLKDPLADEDPVAERIVSLVLAQLVMGPQSIENSDVPRSAWESLLHKALGLAVQHTPVFDSQGLRSIIAIQDDACRVLGIDLQTFYSWENHFGIDLIAERLFDTSTAPNPPLEGRVEAPLSINPEHTPPFRAGSRRVDQNNRGKVDPVLEGFPDSVIFLLGKRIELFAGTRLGRVDSEMAIMRHDEVALQWRIAMISSLPSAEVKVDNAVKYIGDLKKHQRTLACKALALIVMHSDLRRNGSPTDSLLPRWSEADLRALISNLMKSAMWEMVSHRSFRQHLTPEENKIMNNMVFHANYTEAMKQLGEIDVAQISAADFWDAVDRTGVGEIIFADAVARMTGRN